MKAKFLKIAGVKSEKEFYKKYPTESAFFKAHPEAKELKKAQMGFGNLLPVGNAISGALNKDTSGNLFQNPFSKGNLPGTIGSLSGIVGGIQGIGAAKRRTKDIEAMAKLSDLQLRAAGTREEPVRRKRNGPEMYAARPDQLFPSQGTNYDAGFAVGKHGATIKAQDGMQIGGNLTEIQNMYNPGDLYSNLGYEPLSESDVVKQYASGGAIPMGMEGLSVGQVSQIGTGLFNSVMGQSAESQLGGQIGSLFGPAGTLIGTMGGKMLGAGREADEAFAIGKLLRDSQNIAGTTKIRGLQQGPFSGFMRDGGEVSYAEDGWVSHDWQPQKIAYFGEHKMEDLLKPPADADMLRTGGNIRQNNLSELDNFNFGGSLKTHWGGRAEVDSYNPYLPGTGETVMFKGNQHSESDGTGKTGIGVSYGPQEHDSYTDYAEYGSEEAHVEVENGEPAIQLPESPIESPMKSFALGGQQNANNLSMTVFGAIKVNKDAARQIGDPDAEGLTYKNLVKGYNKKENKLNKKLDKANEELANLQVNTPFDRLKLNSLQSTIQGSDQELRKLAAFKINAAGVQNDQNEIADKYGLDVNALAKGEIKPSKDMGNAKYGTKKAQRGTFTGSPRLDSLVTSTGVFPPALIESAYTSSAGSDSKKSPSSSKKSTTSSKKKTSGKKQNNVALNIKPLKITDADFVTPELIGVDYKPKEKSQLELLEEQGLGPSNWKKDIYASQSKASKKAGEKKGKADIGELAKILAGQLPGILGRRFDEPFDPFQTLPERAALSMNQLEPVDVQLLQPLLTQPYQVSLEDQKQQIKSSYANARRLTGNNPSAQAMIAAKESEDLNKINAEEFRMNQGIMAESTNKNREILNAYQQANAAALDKQYERMAGAKSKTKATYLEALKSMVDKEVKHKADMRTLAAYSNLFPQYGFDQNLRTFSQMPTWFQRGIVGSTQDAEEKETKKESTAKHGKNLKKHFKNGSIVKSLKNI